MNLTELIEKLKAAREQHGDTQVVMMDEYGDVGIDMVVFSTRCNGFVTLYPEHLCVDFLEDHETLL